MCLALTFSSPSLSLSCVVLSSSTPLVLMSLSQARQGQVASSALLHSQRYDSFPTGIHLIHLLTTVKLCNCFHRDCSWHGDAETDRKFREHNSAPQASFSSRQRSKTSHSPSIDLIQHSFKTQNVITSTVRNILPPIGSPYKPLPKLGFCWSNRES